MVKLGRELICSIFLGLATLVSSSTEPTGTNQTSTGQASSNASATPLTFAMPLINYYNSEYSGQFQIGDSGESVNLFFDTGALWILVENSTAQAQSSSNCSSSSKKCNLLGYGEVEKTTFQYITNGQTIGGYIVADSFVLNNQTKLNQTLFLPDSTTVRWGNNSDGVCGLSYTNGNHPTLLDNMASKNIISQKQFGLYLSNNPEAYGETTSEIMFGGPNPNYYAGNFTSVSIIPETPYWQANFGGILFSNNNQSASFDFNAYTAIIASGIQNILFSQDDFQVIMDAFTSTYQLNCYPGQLSDSFSCDCPNGDISNFPNISIILDSQPLMIPPSVYLSVTEQGCNILMEGTLGNQQSSFDPAPSTTNETNTTNSSVGATEETTDSSDVETVGLSVTEPGSYIILGAVFLRNYYTVFDADNKMISFAKAVHPPLGLISALQVIYLVLGAFIVILFMAFVGWFVRIMLSKKAPVAEVASPERPLVERKITASTQFAHIFEANEMK